MADTDKKNEQPIMEEISSGERALNLSGFINDIARSSDRVLNSLGGNLKVYKSLFEDDRVFTTFQQRQRALQSVDWEVTPASESPQDVDAADDIREQLKNIKFDAITNKMLYGLMFGYSVGECIWGRDGSRIVLTNIKVRDPSRFRFGIDGSLRLFDGVSGGGELMPDRKFWAFTSNALDDDSPYGTGLGHWLYWPVFLKRNGLKFWAIALEKFGSPTVKGSYPVNATKEDQQKILAAAAAVAQEAAVAFPEGFDLDLVEAVRSAGDSYDKFYQAMNTAITLVVLSQNMTTEDGSSRAQGEVHMDVRQDVVKGDADLTCESLNDGPIRWLTEWNHPGATPPKVWRVIEKPEDLKAAAERDKTLHDIGWTPTEERITDTYGPGYERRSDVKPETKPEAGAEFAEEGAAPDAIEAFFAELAESGEIDEAIEPLLKPLQDRLLEAESFEDMKAVLDEAVTDDHIDAFHDLIAKAMFQARIAGEVDADLDGGDDAV